MSDERVCPGRHTVDRPARALRNDEYLCMGCLRNAERILGDIPALVREVEITVAKQTRTYRAGGARPTADEDWRGTDHALVAHPLPVDIDASVRARTSLELLFEWSDFIAQRNGKRGLPVFTRDKPLPELTVAAVGMLLTYSNFMRSDEQGPDMAEAIRCVRRDLRNLVDCRPERLYAGPCHADLGYPAELGYRCEMKVYRVWGRAEITCDGHDPQAKAGRWQSTGCSTIHTTAERREWLRAEIESSLLPLRVVWEDLYELVPGFSLDWATVKQWARPREQKIPMLDGRGNQRVDRRGRPMVRIQVTPPRLLPHNPNDTVLLYRGSDILRLAEDKQVRRGRRRVQRAEVA